ncbi:hypothetical protein D0869_14076 [Hortaea werneckii]|uniref:Uncharacterized protein n=1 Tax=Hortaea werneckii TaxID=91943 RepID=A0A3M6W348_HORWE|nr:hypothetical protein D0869_14076 [Hortaea werneckii]RMX91322.1 hypothetical protein D0868_14061 [Hortaea werneckii]
MTSFIQTMFVPNSLPQPYSQSPKPLPALHTNVLAESESCLHLPHPPEVPPRVHQSPLQRHIQSVFHGSSNPPSPTHHEKAYAHYFATPNAATAADQEDQYRIHEIHRPGLLLHRGLPQGWLQDVAQKSDLLTRTHSNARNRNQASFQPQKRAKGTNSWQLKQFAEATLGSGSLRKVVQLPEGEDRDEWLAVNSKDSSFASPFHSPP